MRLLGWKTRSHTSPCLLSFMQRLVPACLLLNVLVTGACTSMAPVTPPGVKPVLYGKLYRPTSSNPTPAVILLHGRWGLHSDEYAFAEQIAQHGYVTLVLDYYAGKGALYSRLVEKWETWEQVIRDSVGFLQNMKGVRPDRIALVGLSQGGFLAVSTSSTLPAVKAVVSYYGGATNSLNDYIEDLPPVLLIHGGADTVVPAARSQALYDALVSRGKPVELHIYPGVGHAFNLSGPRYDARAAANAQKRTLAFLGRYLNASKD